MNKTNSIIIKIVSSVLIFTMFFTILVSAQANAASKWEDDYFAYGSGLTEEQLAETERLVGLPQDKNFNRIIVNGDDYKQFTGLAISDDYLFSSAIISKTDKASGVQVYINTPGNITQIKDHQYMNAALTSGITDCTIVVGSPVPVTGESALIGVYKAFKDAGYEINEDATKIATDELVMVNEISQDNKENPDFDSEDFSLAIAEIKKQISEISDKDSISIENINLIINNVLNQYNINISDADKEKLANWLDDFKKLDIDWNVISKELSGLGDLISEKADEIYEWGQASGFFSNLWESIKAFFKSIFN